MPGQFSLADLSPDETKPKGRFSAADVAPDQSAGILPEDTFLPGANKWLKENHPGVYSALEKLMTAVPRGVDQITKGATQPGLRGGERVSNIIEGAETAASPGLLAVPGGGGRAILNTGVGLATGAVAQPIAGGAARILGASPETSRAVGDVAGLAAGGWAAQSGVGGEIPGAFKTGARVATDPAVVRAGVRVLPKGPAIIEAFDKIKASISKTKGEPEPELPQPSRIYTEPKRAGKGRSSAPLPADAPTPAPAAGADYLMPAPEPQIPAGASPSQMATFSPQTVLDYMRGQARPVPETPSEAVSASPKGKVVTIPAPEPEFAAETYKAAAQVKKANATAKWLNENGVDYDTFRSQMAAATPEMRESTLKEAARLSGENQLNSPESLNLMLLELKRLGKQGKLARLPAKASKAAQDLGTLE